MAAFWHRNDSLSLADFYLGGDDTSKGVKMLERLAERGNVEAQLKLGGVYEWGIYRRTTGERIVELNIPAAIKWLKRAADQGDKRGYDGLWQIYLHEGNVDEEKALHYLLIAAQKGAVNAQRFLGVCYMQGSILAVPQNYSEGIKWLRKAARADATDEYETAARKSAQIELAKAYRDGTGVNVDPMKSYIWFSFAARAEVADQRKWVDQRKEWNAGNSMFPLPIKIEKGEAQTERDKIATRLTASQLIEAQNLVERSIANNYEDFD